jgi:hypothetical protein
VDKSGTLLKKTGRCDTMASHKIKIKNITETTEITDPILAKIFQVE